MKITFLTLGCKQNQYETERLRNVFIKKGHSEVSLSEHPNIVFLNTCAVTGQASRQSRNLLRRALRTGKKVVVGGCDAKIFSDIYRNYPDTYLTSFDNFRYNLSFFSHRARAFVKIQTGCNNFCAYCIVPYARGHAKTRDRQQILDEVKLLKENGHKEVVLTGTHIGQYGIDNGEKLSDLILEIKKLGVNIRLTSLMPNEITDDILLLLNEGVITPHFHISVQAGADKILKKMFRNYTRKQIYSTVFRINRINPYAAIGADFIVGFPGEDESEFQDTADMVKSLPFSYLHIFRYSPRTYTVAAHYPDTVVERVTKERSRYLIQLGKEKNFLFRRQFLGDSLPAYGEREKSENKYVAFTENYIRVFLDEEPKEEGFVKISAVEENETYGTRI